MRIGACLARGAACAWPALASAAQAPVLPAQAPVLPAQAPVLPAQAPVLPAQAPVALAQAPVALAQALGPAAIAERVGIEQRLGERLPLDAELVDQDGRRLRLGELFGERPVLLTFVYYECPMLCTEVLNGLARALAPLDLRAGEDFELVAISIDPGETPELALEKRRRYLARARAEADRAGWHFLVGSPEAIETTTRAAGFRYLRLEPSGEFAHAGGIMVATPAGVLSRYLYGVEYAPRDLKLALLEASQGRVGNLVDAFLMLCFRYDAASGRYTLAILRLLRVFGVLTVALLGGWILWMRRREPRTSAGCGAQGA